MSNQTLAPFGYPSEGFVKSSGGCKVGRLYYETKEQAEAALPLVAEKTRKALDRGYDFGYMWPGEIFQEPSTKLWVIVTP